MKYKLRNYQEAVLNSSDHLASVAYYMATGTGKTLVSLTKFKDNLTTKLLVICPHSVQNQWKSFIKDILGKARVMDFKNNWSASKKNEHIEAEFHKHDIIIVNFEIVPKLTALKNIITEDWTIIVDEIHRIKGWGTRKKPVITTRAVCALGEKTPYKIGLTATPSQSKYGGLIDYYPQLLFLGYTDMTYEKFWERYVIFREKAVPTIPWPIKEIVGYKNREELESLIELMARRYVSTYEEFEPQHTKIYLEKGKNYGKLIRERAMTCTDKTSPHYNQTLVLNNVSRKRQAVKTYATGTVMGRSMFGDQVFIDDNTIKLDWVKDFLLDTEERVVIFYQYTIEGDNLEELVRSIGKKPLRIMGGTKHKYELINDTEYDVVIGQYQAMAEGLDGLHKKSHIAILFSMPESSLLYVQAIGRIDREGQTQVPMYYYPLMKGTLDIDIMRLIEEKVDFSESVLDRLLVEV